MTQASNLAKGGSNFNADGDLSLTTGVTGTLPVANGGTGSTTTTGAANAILPSQTSNSGKYLTTNGTDTSWGTVTSNPGTVTSVNLTAGTAISVSGGPITSSGSITVTNTGVTSVTGAGTVSVSASTGGVTITGTGGSGTVTSVATGNGLSGGTITSTGTLVVACPTYNTVGSYCQVITGSLGTGTSTSGTNYAAGSGVNQISAMGGATGQNCGEPSGFGVVIVNNLSGTWKWMAGTVSSGGTRFGIACRVS
jgi:hypothetical protein